MSLLHPFDEGKQAASEWLINPIMAEIHCFMSLLIKRCLMHGTIKLTFNISEREILSLAANGASLESCGEIRQR